MMTEAVEKTVVGCRGGGGCAVVLVLVLVLVRGMVK
jgi:hypothetical protein